MAEITILSHDTRWKGRGPAIRRVAEAVLAHKRVKKAAVTIVLTNDTEIKELNKDYRGKSKPTNVLSFPDGARIDGVKQLGDIVLAYETIVTEAYAQGKTLRNHITHLVIHGVLHLLGYDHEVEKEAEIMESLEISILARMGIANPYESA